MLPIRTILFPTDFSPTSNAAFRIARSIARDYNAKLIVFHVAQFPSAMGADGVLMYPTDYDLDALRRKLDDIPTGSHIEMERRLVQGNAIDEILNAAQDLNCDLIVLGTHGRTGVGRLFMGSVAEQIIRKATCAVLSVKAPIAAAVIPVDEAALAVGN